MSELEMSELEINELENKLVIELLVVELNEMRNLLWDIILKSSGMRTRHTDEGIERIIEQPMLETIKKKINETRYIESLFNKVTNMEEK